MDIELRRHEGTKELFTFIALDYGQNRRGGKFQLMCRDMLGLGAQAGGRGAHVPCGLGYRDPLLYGVWCAGRGGGPEAAAVPVRAGGALLQEGRQELPEKGLEEAQAGSHQQLVCCVSVTSRCSVTQVSG